MPFLLKTYDNVILGIILKIIDDYDDYDDLLFINKNHIIKNFNSYYNSNCKKYKNWTMSTYTTLDIKQNNTIIYSHEFHCNDIVRTCD